MFCYVFIYYKKKNIPKPNYILNEKEISMKTSVIIIIEMNFRILKR